MNSRDEEHVDMTDKEFLYWLSQRLVKVYGENQNVDFVLKLRAIARSLPLTQTTPNTTEPNEQ